MLQTVQTSKARKALVSDPHPPLCDRPSELPVVCLEWTLTGSACGSQVDWYAHTVRGSRLKATQTVQDAVSRAIEAGRQQQVGQGGASPLDAHSV